MSLKRLRIESVRCLSHVDIELDARRNYLFGPNAAGKTSFLEALYLLGRGRSFRLRQTARLVQYGRPGFSVFGQTHAREGREHRLGVAFTQGRISTQLDGQAAASQADMLRVLPVHVIDPRLHRLIEAGPTERRRFIDAGVFHVERRFLADWRQYRRVLGQRNAALKAKAGRQELEPWTQPLIEAGNAVHGARLAYLEALGEIAAGLGERLLQDRILLEYRSGWRRGVEFAVALEEHLERDRASGFTQLGPHRADLRLDFARGEVRETASRGQQKLVAAALVIAQVTLFERRTGRPSTVLVDDAPAELDRAAQVRLRGELERLDSQLVLTGLSREDLAAEPGFPVFHVEQGKIQAVL